MTSIDPEDESAGRRRGAFRPRDMDRAERFAGEYLRKSTIARRRAARFALRYAYLIRCDEVIRDVEGRA